MTWEIAVGIFAIVSFAAVVIGWSGKISDASDSFVPKEVADETDEAIDSSKEYVKVLDETTLHIDKVIESLILKMIQEGVVRIEKDKDRRI